MKKSRIIYTSITALLILIVSIFLFIWSNNLNNEIQDSESQLDKSETKLLELDMKYNQLEDKNQSYKKDLDELSNQLTLRENMYNTLKEKHDEMLDKLGVITEDYFGETIEISEFEYIGSFMNGDKVYIEPYNYYVQEAAWSMLIVRDDLIIEYIDSFPSKPKFNDDRTKILYTDYLQFEVIGNVSIYDSEKREITIHTNYGYDSVRKTVKDVEWYSETSVLCIVGFDTGTVTQGGIVYYLNLETQVLIEVIPENRLLEWTDRPYEVVDVSIDLDKLIITLVEWSDDNYNDYYYTTHEIYISETNIQ